MFDEQALTKLQEAATTEHLNTLTAHGTLVAPSDFKIHDLEPFAPHRTRMRGVVKTPDLTSLASYVESQGLAHVAPVFASSESGEAVLNGATQSAIAFVDTQSRTATVVLNLHEGDDPGHCDHLAIWKPALTPAAQEAIKLICGGDRKWPQQDLVEFLEDNRDYITFYRQTEALDVPKVHNALRNINIKATRDAGSAVADYAASTSVLESVTVDQAKLLPSHIYFTAQPFDGFAMQAWVFRLGIDTSGDKPTMRVRCVNGPSVDHAIGQEMVDKVAQALKLPTVIGTFDKGQ